MTWYQEGTMSVTQNSTSVAGVSTRWVSNVRTGEALLAPDGRFYEVTAIASDKAMTIAPAYKGATAAAQVYAIVPIQGYVKRLADQAARILNGITLGLDEKADKAELPAAVRAALLDGIAFDVATAVVADDNVLQALGKLQAQASNKVDKVAGKGLSSNDFTNTERVKLANIAEQATRNASDAALRDRATHTGAQAIGTVSGLQAELDAKETPAGALAQIRSYGAGVNAAPYTLNLETHRIGGRFTADAATSTASGLPLPLQHTIDYLPGVNAQTGLMEASALTGNATNGGRKWMRKLNGGVWQSWIEIQTVDGSLLQMQGVGIGATTAPITTTPNSLIAGGAYRMGVAVSAEAGLPLAVGHTVLNLPGDGTNGAHQFLSPITSVTANRDRLWHRQQLTANWSAPKEFAYLESTFPNVKLGNVASADANTLDYYEEGVFTPTLFGMTTAGTVTYLAGIGGNYTRIGNRVFWDAWVAATAIAGMQGVVRMGGLPYIVRNSPRNRGAVTLSQVAALASTDILQLSAFHFNNTASVEFLKRSTGQTSFSGLQASDITNASQFYLSGQYEVNQ